MVESCNSFSTFIHSIPSPFSSKPKILKQTSATFIIQCSKAKDSKKDETPQALKKNFRTNSRAQRSLITISTSDGRWHGQWNYDYIFSLKQLQLTDVAEEDQKYKDVTISLSVKKHAGFGFSVDGRITTSFTRKCSNCFSPYCKEIDTTFDVWILPSSRVRHTLRMSEIDSDDPSVIYVKLGSEAYLDSLIQDTIRLTASVKDTCSESCEKSPPSFHYIGGNANRYVDKRWSRLLEIKI